MSISELKWGGLEKEPSELFVDRDDPADVFFDVYKALDCEDEDCNSKVIAYFGEGGIGKTWLLHQRIETELKKIFSDDREPQQRLTQKIKQKKEEKDKIKRKGYKKDCIVAYYDLDNKTDLIEMLCSLRAQVAVQRPEFTFLTFDAAIKRYEELGGSVKITTNENNNYASIDSILDTVLKVASVFPGLGEISTAYQAVKSGTIFLKGKLENMSLHSEIKKALRDVDKLKNSEDVFRSIINFFAFDILCNTQKSAIVFLIDTVEWLQKEDTSQEQLLDKIIVDLPQKTRNCLWVFASRLKVYEKDSLHKLQDEPVQYELGDLSEEYSKIYFREKWGIEDEVIIQRMYEISCGTPMFLELCAKNYFSIKDEQGNVTVENFNISSKAELVKRYLKYLKNYEARNILYDMSAMMHWKYEDFKEVFMEVHGHSEFTDDLPAYNELIKSTMINDLGDEKYVLHRSVREAIYDHEDYPSETRDRVNATTIKLYLKRVIEENVDLVYYKDRICEVLERAAAYNETPDDVSRQRILAILDIFRERIPAYGIYHIDSLIAVLERTIPETLNDIIDIQYCLCLANMYYLKGNYEKAYYEYNGIVLPTSILKDEPLLSSILHNLALCEFHMSDPEDKDSINAAIAIMNVAVNKKTECFGENDNETLASVIDLAEMYKAARDYRKSIKLMERVLKHNKPDSNRGKKNLLSAGTALADLYYIDKNPRKALKKAQEIYDLFESEIKDTDQHMLVLRDIIANCRDNNLEDLSTHEKLFEDYKIGFGETHPKTLEKMESLINAYLHNGQNDLAVAKAMELLEIDKNLYGENGPQTLLAMMNLGNIHIKTDSYEDYVKAISIFEDLMPKFRLLVGENEPASLNIMNNLGLAYCGTAKYDKAYDIQRELIDKFAAIYGGSDINTLVERVYLANTCFYDNNFEEAIKELKEVYEKMAKNSNEFKRAGLNKTKEEVIPSLIVYLSKQDRNEEAADLERLKSKL